MATKPYQHFLPKYPSFAVHTTFQAFTSSVPLNIASFLLLCVQAPGQYVDQLNGIILGITGIGPKGFLRAVKKKEFVSNHQ